MSAIEFTNVVKRYGAVEALAGVSFSVNRGEMFGLIGPDGAGKTTAIRLMCGLLHADSGTIRVLGHDPVVERRVITALVGYLSQRFSLYGDLTIDENIAFFAEMHGIRNYQRRRDQLLDIERAGFRHLDLANTSFQIDQRELDREFFVASSDEAHDRGVGAGHVAHPCKTWAILHAGSEPATREPLAFEQPLSNLSKANELSLGRLRERGDDELVEVVTEVRIALDPSEHRHPLIRGSRPSDAHAESDEEHHHARLQPAAREKPLNRALQRIRHGILRIFGTVMVAGRFAQSRRSVPGWRLPVARSRAKRTRSDKAWPAQTCAGSCPRRSCCESTCSSPRARWLRIGELALASGA